MLEGLTGDQLAMDGCERLVDLELKAIMIVKASIAEFFDEILPMALQAFWYGFDQDIKNLRMGAIVGK